MKETCFFQNMLLTSISEKPEEFQNKCQNIAKGFDYPNRIKIIMLILSAEKEMNVTDLSLELGIEQSSLSHQLKILRNAGILSRRLVGRESYHFIDDQRINLIFAYLTKTFGMENEELLEINQKILTILHEEKATNKIEDEQESDDKNNLDEHMTN